MRKKLIQSDFITEDLYVKCSLKEYNEYKRFLENEFLKVGVCASVCVCARGRLSVVQGNMSKMVTARQPPL